jgi:hypothetical protein
MAWKLWPKMNGDLELFSEIWMEFLDRGHLAAFFGGLEAVGKDDQVTAHRHGGEGAPAPAHPEIGETIELYGAAVEEVQHRFVV